MFCGINVSLFVLRTDLIYILNAETLCSAYCNKGELFYLRFQLMGIYRDAWEKLDVGLISLFHLNLL